MKSSRRTPKRAQRNNDSTESDSKQDADPSVTVSGFFSQLLDKQTEEPVLLSPKDAKTSGSKQTNLGLLPDLTFPSAKLSKSLVDKESRPGSPVESVQSEVQSEPTSENKLAAIGMQVENLTNYIKLAEKTNTRNTVIVSVLVVLLAFCYSLWNRGLAKNNSSL
jgi:hypothetical protein